MCVCVCACVPFSPSPVVRMVIRRYVEELKDRVDQEL